MPEARLARTRENYKRKLSVGEQRWIIDSGKALVIAMKAAHANAKPFDHDAFNAEWEAKRLEYGIR